MPDQLSFKSPPFPVTLPVYQGPLDLLLQLIEREELDITKVALAQVTEQYLAHVRTLERHNLGDIADFLIIAAKLILIKSEALLPRPPQRAAGEEDPGEELARQLILYKKYKEIASALHERETEGLRTFLRTAAPPKVEAKLDISNVTPDDLWQAVTRALSLMPDAPSVSSVVAPSKITIRDRIRRIQHTLRSEGRARFFDLLKEATSRVEIVVTFLAVLELVKQGRVIAAQEKLFGDIVLEPVGDWVNDDSIQFYSEMESPEGAEEQEPAATEDSNLS
ncbi:MAG TPA: segregation/condensation protein A [Anaerolineales bacterium]|nr:segregation/condensation protein A [Anaerolineales bacterium]HLB46061.1 segregation/condensation protein A [Anaerolineales bacterium]